MAGPSVSAGVKTIEQSFMSLLSFPQSAHLSFPRSFERESRKSIYKGTGSPFPRGQAFERESRKKLVRHPILSLVLFLLLITPSLSFASCCVDVDGDGYSDHKSCRSGTDCDDDNKFIRPGTLGCNNCKDVDDDGYFAHDLLDCSLGDDLDDNDPEANPGKDGGGGNGGGGGCSSVVWYKDVDDDKYSANGVLPLTQCDQPPGYKPASDLIQISGDCEDDPSVEPLAYIIHPGAEEVCDGWEHDNNCDGVKDEGCCEIGSMVIWLSNVQPQRTYGGTTANLFLELSKPAPPDGCTVELSVEPVLNDFGGHNHANSRPLDKIGKLTDKEVSFSYNETGPEIVTYISSEVSGEEKIKANVKESGKSAETSVTVRVPGLSSMSGSSYYRFTGQTSKHLDNHYGTLGTNTNASLMAQDFYNQFKATLGINDMSLELGGMFDICGTWKVEDACSNAPNGGHKSHRVGTSVDIDGTAVGVTGSIKVDKKKLQEICEKRGGRLANEVPIHCEF